MSLNDLVIWLVIWLGVETLIIVGLLFLTVVLLRVRRQVRIEPQKKNGLGQVLTKLRK
jgi:hypothetical protein